MEKGRKEVSDKRPTLEELHNAYMSARDFENDYEAQQINEYYCNNGDDIVELPHWTPVAKPQKTNILHRVIKER